MGNVAKEIFGMMAQEAKSALQEVEISSAILPTIRVGLPGGKAPGKPDVGAKGKGKPASPGLLAQIQPVVTVRSTAGDIRVAPGGEPKVLGGKFPLVAAGVAGAAVLAVTGTAVVVAQGKRGVIPVALAALLAAGVYWYERRKLLAKQRAR